MNLRGVLPRGPARVIFVLAAFAAVGSFVYYLNERGRDQDPPERLGMVERKGPLSCPDIAGDYAWSWKPAGTDAATRREPTWKGNIPFYLFQPETQLRVSLEDKALVLRSRLIVRREGVRNRLAVDWTTSRYERWEYACRWGVLEVEEAETSTGEDYGGTGIRRGFKLFTQADGALVLGVRTTSYGRTGALFAWGDVSRGSIPLPSRTSWKWTRLTRQAAPASRSGP